MAEDWNFYFSRVDGALASVFVDLGFGADATDQTRSVAVWVSLKMLNARADGLSSTAEADMLFLIGDVLAAEATQHDALFVGRVTHNGHRDFFFYVAPGRQTDLLEALRRRVSGFSAYSFEAGERPDPSWAIYREYLYPDPYGLRQINDNKVLISLREHGDDPTKARPVDFDFVLPNAAAGDALIAWARLRNFTVTSRTSEADGEVVYLRRDQNMLSIQDDLGLLYERAEVLGGAMTGWGTLATP